MHASSAGSVAASRSIAGPAAAAKARALKGKLRLTIDIETSRERAHH